MKKLFTLLAISVLTACGGGSDETPSIFPPVVTPPTGVFAPAPEGTTPIVFPPLPPGATIASTEHRNSKSIAITKSDGVVKFDIGEKAEWGLDGLSIALPEARLSTLRQGGITVTAVTLDGRIFEESFSVEQQETNIISSFTFENQLNTVVLNNSTLPGNIESVSVSIDGGTPTILTQPNRYPIYFSFVPIHYAFMFPDLRPGTHTATGIVIARDGNITNVAPITFEVFSDPVMRLRNCGYEAHNQVMRVLGRLSTHNLDEYTVSVSVGDKEYSRESTWGTGDFTAALWTTDLPKGDYYITAKALKKNGTAVANPKTSVAVCKVTVTK